MATPLSTSLILELLLLAPQLVSATCYWQNSTLAPDSSYSIATDDTACFPDQENSPCCGTGWTCLSDGVCFIHEDNTDFYYRGTCTDRTWNSQQCPGWCFAQNSNSSIPLAKCDTDQDWYCCPGDADCSCETGKNALKLAGEQPSTITVIGSTSWPGITSTTSPFTATPLATEGTTTETRSQAPTTSGSGTNSKSSSTAGAAASSATSRASPGSSGGGSSNTGLAAGLGAGLGAAAVLSGILILYLVRNRRKQSNTSVGIGPDYGGMPETSAKVQKPFYSGPQQDTPYSDDTYMDVVQYQPELPGQGEHNRAEMWAETQDQTRSKSQHRAELDAS